MGVRPLFSQEFEWFNFDETPDSLHDKQGINPQTIDHRDVWLFIAQSITKIRLLQ